MLCDKCNKHHCADEPCACPEPFLDVFEKPFNPGVVVFNDNGKTAKVNWGPITKHTETDTSLVADIIERLLRFSAERHTDTITAKELGAILHLTDLGDVSNKALKDGSMLFYNKDSRCAEGCVGDHDQWDSWNAIDGQDTALYYPMGFDNNGKPKTLAQPEHPNEFYMMAWDGKRQVSYSQVTEATTAPIASDGKKLRVYLDESTKKLVYVRED